VPLLIGLIHEELHDHASEVAGVVVGGDQLFMRSAGGRGEARIRCLTGRGLQGGLLELLGSIGWPSQRIALCASAIARRATP
jgi:hypothetical protein